MDFMNGFNAREEGVLNDAYIKLLEIIPHKGKVPTARVELDFKTAPGIERKEVEVDMHADFEEITGLETYSEIEILAISSASGLNITVGDSE
jgi:hypothetical protein